MKQGASRHAFAERGNDLYETPACCVAAALANGIFGAAGRHIWEPCAGRGAVARELRADSAFLHVAKQPEKAA
jgi:hypothetical protein